MQHASLTLVCCALFLFACPKEGGGGGAPDAGQRCVVDLAATGYFKQDGSGANAAYITGDAQLIGGEGAQGRPGDVLLQNDKVRVIIEQPGRTVGPMLSGGGIIDADLQRSGEAGRDVFGRMGLFYSFGRLPSVKQVEVLSDGANGGPAVVAATGVDVPHDLLNIESLIQNVAGLNVKFVVDPTKPVPVRTTTYYVLSPGESRVRVMSAFCNDGDSPAVMPLIELMDVGAFEIFNSGPCGNALGLPKPDVSNNCTIAPSKWFGVQGDGVAYGLRSMSLADPTKPVEANAVLGYGGVLGTFVEGESLDGLLSWTNAEARTRPGTFLVRGQQQRVYLRDFAIARDLASVDSVFKDLDGVALGTVNVTATLPGGAAAGDARVTVLSGTKMVGLLEADATGHATARLAAGTYTLSGSLQGHLVGPTVDVTVTAGADTTAAVVLGEGRKVNVSVRDVSGARVPAKVTVFCAGGACPFNKDTYAQHVLLDYPGQGAAAIAYVPISGDATLTLPPGEYDVVVSRGPEYSTWPDTWPTSGHRVDLRTADATVAATIGRIVDTTGWMSADLHVHAYNSSDSAVGNWLRAANFLAEGVDVLLSTDHEYIFDYAPVVRELGAQDFIATMIGEEVTSFTHGHFNAFPLAQDTSFINGGAFDHAGGEDGPGLRLPQLFAGIKEKWPGATVQLNHPRSSGGSMTLLQVDTATLASHGDPALFNMAPAPDATANDTKLFGDGFDLVEVANGPNPSWDVMNDWMTFLSRGTVRAASGVSDSHSSFSDTGGYARTWAKVGVDTPAQFQPQAFADAIRAQKLFSSNGPLLNFTAQKLDAQGNPTGPVVDIGGTLSAANGETVRFTVDVQGLEWMQLDRVELYSHAPGRESVNGVSNNEWPEGRILQKKELDPSMATLEPVAGAGNLRRVHLTETFDVVITHDTWFVGMARSINGRSMAPLHSSKPLAWSNAILIDGDGSGAYDDFPLKPGQPLSAPVKKDKGPVVVPTRAQFLQAIADLILHGDEH